MTPDRTYDRRWALAIMERGMTPMEEEFAAQGRREIFLGLRGLIAGGRDAGFAAVAARLGCPKGRPRWRGSGCAGVTANCCAPK